MNPRITRIKFHADGRLVVGYQLPNRKDPDVLDDFTITSADTPAPTFSAALLELQPFLLEHAGLPSGTRLVITRMQIRWLGASSVRRLVLTAEKPAMSEARKPTTLKATIEGPHITTEGSNALRKVLLEAIRYIHGQRAQMGLGLGKPTETKEEA